MTYKVGDRVAVAWNMNSSYLVQQAIGHSGEVVDTLTAPGKMGDSLLVRMDSGELTGEQLWVHQSEVVNAVGTPPRE